MFALPLPARRFVAAGSLVLTAGMSAALPTSAEAAATPQATFGGSAYGSTVAVGSLASSGRTAYVAMCTSQVGFLKTSNTAAVNLTGVANIGAATTSVSTDSSTAGLSSVARSRTGEVSLLGGLISATEVTSSSTLTRTPSGTYKTTGSSRLTGLRIAGSSVDASPSPNTTVSIPGVATVKLNAQATSTSAGTRTLAVVGIQVTLLAENSLGLPTGTITVATSNATQNLPVFNKAYGSAYGTKVEVGDVIRSGATAEVSIGCGGTNGVTRTNNVAGVDVAPLIKAGAVATTAQSTDAVNGTRTITTAKVEGITLLGGIVSVDGVNARAQAGKVGTGSVSSSSTGTEIVNLKINGASRVVSSAENSKIQIAGVGTLVLRATTRTSTGINVTALQLTLDTEQLGIPSGTTIRVANTSAGVE